MTCATKLEHPAYDCKQRCIHYTECYSKHVKAKPKQMKVYEYRNVLDESTEELRADVRSMSEGF